MTYGNGLYVIGGRSGTILKSTDAITWDKIDTGLSHIQGLTYHNNVFIAVGNSGAIILSGKFFRRSPRVDSF